MVIVLRLEMAWVPERGKGDEIMPKNSSAARRQAARQMAAAEGLSYTAALRHILAAAAEAAQVEPGHIRYRGDLLSREAALALVEQHQQYPVEVRACQACGHVHFAHYDPPAGRPHGCVACEQAGRLCPVFVPGGVPKLAQHVDPLSTDPVPCPWLCAHGLDRHSAGSGCFRCGCQYGVVGADAPAGVVYHGYPWDGPGGRVVVIEAPAGHPVSLLPHVSPTEFAWGYGGAGPRELARCLLLAALGPAATCPRCRGAGKMTVGEAGVQVPYGPGLQDGCDPEAIIPCMLCDDGYRAVPHQKFKFQVVATWDQDAEWALDRTQIITWLCDTAPDLAADAVAWPANDLPSLHAGPAANGISDRGDHLPV
jgi:hypothetical protein